MPNEEIANKKIEELKEILRLSPSSINSQPWKFIFVSDKKVKKELAEVSYFNDKKIMDSSHIIVFKALDRVDRFEENMHNDLPESSINYYNRLVKPLGESAIRSWLQHQVYLSLGFFLSACASMDIDSTPMEGIQTEEYDKILATDGYKTLFAVAIGYRDPEDANQPSIKAKSRLPIEQIIQSI